MSENNVRNYFKQIAQPLWPKFAVSYISVHLTKLKLRSNHTSPIIAKYEHLIYTVQCDICPQDISSTMAPTGAGTTSPAALTNGNSSSRNSKKTDTTADVETKDIVMNDSETTAVLTAQLNGLAIDSPPEVR